MRPQLDAGNGTVYCDWRVNIYDCVEEGFFQSVYIATIVMSLLCVCLVAFDLSFRYYHWKIGLFHKGDLRGAEGFLFSLLLYNLLQSVHCIITIADPTPPRVLSEILVGFSSTFGLTGIAAYLHSFVRAGPTHKSLASFWLTAGSARLFGFAVIEIFVVEFISFVVLGVYGQNGSDAEATVYAVVVNSQAVHWLTYEICFLYIGLTFSSLLQKNLESVAAIDQTSKKARVLRITVAKIRQVIRGILYMSVYPIIWFILANCYYVYAVLPWSKAMCVLYFLTAPICIFLLTALATFTDIRKYRLGLEGDTAAHVSSSDASSQRRTVEPDATGKKGGNSSGPASTSVSNVLTDDSLLSRQGSDFAMDVFLKSTTAGGDAQMV